MTFSNEKLRHIKRKAEVQTLSFESFNCRKLIEVGNRGMFETDRKYGYKTAGLLSGFTDILGTQLYYKTVLTVNKAQICQNFSESNTVDAWVTRSWDNSFNCTDCKVKHSLFRYDYFAVMLGDQHSIAKVPSVDGVCIASCRMEGFTLSMLLDHILYMLTTAAMVKTEPRRADEFCPVHALQEAIKLGKDTATPCSEPLI